MPGVIHRDRHNYFPRYDLQDFENLRIHFFLSSTATRSKNRNQSLHTENSACRVSLSSYCFGRKSPDTLDPIQAMRKRAATEALRLTLPNPPFQLPLLDTVRTPLRQLLD